MIDTDPNKCTPERAKKEGRVKLLTSTELGEGVLNLIFLPTELVEVILEILEFPHILWDLGRLSTLYYPKFVVLDWLSGYTSMKWLGFDSWGF